VEQKEEAAAQIGLHTDVRMRIAGVLEELSDALASARASLSNFLDSLSLEPRLFCSYE
jgi:hypothetical protein